MPKRTSGGGALRSAKRTVFRYCVKAAIIVAGAAVAAGTLYKPLLAPESRPLAQAVSTPAFPISLGSRTAAQAAKPFTTGLQHASVQHWIGKLASDGGGALKEMLGGMTNYASMISSKLEERQMPSDLTYLAAIESEGKPTARSRVGAVGLWQFMASTARGLGLTVHGKTDQRRDPAKETDAALAYLSSLHDQFGSWYLAAAAYNAGDGAVQRAMEKVLGRSSGTDEDFFTIAPALPKETQDYVPKLIATAQLANDPAQFGVSLQGLPKPTAAPLPAIAQPLSVPTEPATPRAPAATRHTATAKRTSRLHHMALPSSKKRRTRSHRSKRA